MFADVIRLKGVAAARALGPSIYLGPSSNILVHSINIETYFGNIETYFRYIEN